MVARENFRITDVKKILIKTIWLLILFVFVSTNGISVHAQGLPRLSTLLVTPEDFKAYNHYVANTSERIWVIDRSEELINHCPIDCVKMVWYVPVRNYWPDGYRKLTIVLIRTTTSEKAIRAVDSLYQQLNDPTDPEFWDHTDDFNWTREGLTTNTWAVYNDSFFLGTSYESIIMLLSMKMRGFHDIDDLGEINDLIDFAQLQLSVLKDAGY
jgi:hypothetical protein